MKRLLTLVLLFLALFVNAQTADNIRSIDGLVAWFSADSVHLTTDNHVDTLYDKSGNERHAIQNTVGKQPTFVKTDEYINNQPTIEFDGNDYFISSSNEIFNQPNTLFAIWKSNSTKISVCLTGMGTAKRNQLVASGNDIYIYSGNIMSSKSMHAPFNHIVSNVIFNNDNSYLSCNGELLLSGIAGNYPQKGLVIGAENGGTYGLTGNISDLLFFNGILSSSDSTIVMDFLRDKYSDKRLIFNDYLQVDYGFAPVEYTAVCDWAQTFLWDDGNETPNITISDSKKHYLTVTDKFGFKHSDYIQVKYPAPSLPNDTVFCYGEKSYLDAYIPGEYTFLWSNGSTEPKIEITESGQYKITITDKDGYQWSKTINVRVDEFAKLDILKSETYLCEGDTIKAWGNADYSEYKFLWNTEDTAYKISVKTAGSYSVSVTDSNGCVLKDTTIITIKGVAPKVNIITDTVHANEETSFTSIIDISANSNITEYKWTFGDGDSASISNPYHIYKKAGTYSSSLTVTEIGGCFNTAYQQVKVLYDKKDLVKLSYPSDGQHIFTDTVTIKWKPIYKCDKYQIQVARDKDFNDILVSDTTSITSFFVKNLEIGRTYYWRIRSEAGKFGQSQTFKCISIKQIGGLIAWFSADSIHLTEGNKVDTLFDKSGNKRHAIQNKVDGQPCWIETESYLNGQPSILFDGNDFMISASNEIFNQPNTLFTIWKSNSTKVSVCLTGMESTKRNQLVSSEKNVYTFAGEILPLNLFQPPFNYIVSNALFNNEYSRLSCNGDYISSGDNGNYPQKGLVIGAENGGTYGLSGNVSELIFINGILSSSDSSIIMDYLQDKYSGKQLSLNNLIRVDYGFTPIEYTAVCDWAQSFLWDDGNETPSITISDSKKHYLTVTDKFGFKHSDYIQVDYPKIGVLTDTLICLGDTITWAPDLAGPYYYLWSDGSADKTLKIHEEGQYWVVITDTTGYEWHSDTIFVKVDRFPEQMTLGADTINTCIGNNIYLQSGFDEATRYQWSDGTTADHLVVKSAGSYSVTASNLRGCIGHDTAHINTMGTAPTVGFDNSSLCATRQIAFTDKSSSNDSGKITSYHWDFGDGGFSSAMNPAHIYDTSGNFQISYTISCENGCSNILKKNIYVNALPKADFSTSQACSNAPTRFTSTSTTANGYLTSWQWNINDSTYGIQNPQATFTQYGRHTIELIVTANNGCTDTLRRNIDILQGPEVDFTYSAPCFDSPIYLTNNSKTILGLSSSYTWKSDTAIFSTQKSPSITYKDTTTHQVTLTIKQIANGCISSLTKEIRVMPNPVPSILTGKICEGQDAILEGYNLEHASISKKWLWTIDSLQFTGGHRTSRTFGAKGKHKISLQITDSAGCVATFDTTVSVHETPTATFRPLPTRGPVPFQTEFTNTSANADSLLWIFGDGEESTDIDVCHTYHTDGIYNVQLIASNSFCSDTAQQVIEAIYPQIDIVLVSASAKTDNGQIAVSAVVANRSNYDIPNVSILWYDNVGHRISETIADTIKQGKIVQYEFVAKIGEARPDRIQYICVSAEPSTAYTDDTPSDNEYCIIFNKDEFSVCQPMPNPAKDKLAISYILPNDGNVRIELYNHNGGKIGNLYDSQASAGYNVHNFDVSTLNPGIYFYRITSGNESKTQMLIIER